MEVFQLAGEAGEIAGVAAVMFAITLVVRIPLRQLALRFLTWKSTACHTSMSV
jgi:hypothetical protein